MTGPAMRYESDPKRSDPWQPGRRGAQCPTDVTAEVARRLLQSRRDRPDRPLELSGSAYS